LKWIIPFIVLILVVTGISGCTDSDSQTTNKHFDNGVIAFDYPSNMEVVDQGSNLIRVMDDSNYIVYTSPISYTIINRKLNYHDPIVTITNTTINGRTAYTAIDKSENKTHYFTLIDIGTGYIQIFPSSDPNVQDQKDSSYYKTYQMVVNSFQVK
jgi:hypothetical protein